MIRKLFSCCALLTIFLTNTVEGIIHGHRTPDNTFRYQVSIQVPDLGHKCGGGIINEHYVLTAAHCFVRNDDPNLKVGPRIVLAGTNNLHHTDPPAITVHITKVFLPSVFRRTGGPGNDIAICKLARPLPLPPHGHHLVALKLPENEHHTYKGETAQIAGFGWDWFHMKGNVPHGNLSDGHLRFNDAQVLDHCPLSGGRMEMPEELLCATGHQHDPIHHPIGASNGDSGGPLVHAGVVIGILSLSPEKFSEVDTGAIYTRVSRHLTFIHRVLRNHLNGDVRVIIPGQL